MLSKKERIYLSESDFSKSYGYVLEHRIKKKLNQFIKLELPLIIRNHNLTEFYKDLTENSNDKATLLMNYKGEEGIRTPIKFALQANA